MSDRSLARPSLGAVTVRRAITVVALVAAWCALWQSFSVANILSGLVVAVVSFAVGMGGSGRGGIRPIPLARFVWVVVVDLVVSTFAVARAALSVGERPDEAVVAVSISNPSRDHLLLLYVAITVTPGTAVVAAEADGSVLYLHLLDVTRREATERHVHLLCSLASEALPVEPGSAAPIPEPHSSQGVAP